MAGLCRKAADLAKDTELVNKLAGAGKIRGIIAIARRQPVAGTLVTRL